jgi:hypothetical protein
MRISMGNALALMCWQGSRFLRDFNSRDFAWLLIGALAALLMIWGYSKRRRRWL